MPIRQPVPPSPFDQTPSDFVLDHAMPRPQPPDLDLARIQSTQEDIAACMGDLSTLIEAKFLSLEQKFDMLSSQVDIFTRHITAAAAKPNPSAPLSSGSAKLSRRATQPLSTNKDQSKAAACGISGIPYDPSYVQKLDHSAARIAGALGLSDISKLWALFLEDASTKPLLEYYINARRDSFGWPNSKQYNSLYPDVMAVLWTHFTLKPLMLADTPPTKTSMGVTSRMFYSISTGWYASQVMKAKPGLFPRSHLLGKGDDDVHIDPCDWLHAWKLVSFFWMRSIEGSVPSISDNDVPLKPVYNWVPDPVDVFDVGGGRGVTERMEIEETKN
ncbi:uncharacterized protein APUU_60327A [Aspergillus puulaauensis]|uniref:Uncharacterized protein n=1 Tax=Aspergillus puulaauensis TaxID=1220207 RepID=A0A7R8APM4_9EURO|nr:uncharacterized protein APUU_60327A [Aspergillus puulaauensis]BCS27279.1 hypothetical protein APUU_60327A [Aspergillus puulaauensis]